MRRVTLTILLVAALFAPAIDAQQAPATRIADRTGGAQRTDGFIPFYWDAARGRVLIEIPAFGEDVLYYVSAASGAGSVEMPFDRGILSSGVIRFERSGPRVLVVRRTSTIAPSAARRRRSRTSATRSPRPCWRRCRSKPTKAAACSPMPRRSSCAMRPTSKAACVAPNQGAFRFDAARSALLPAAHEGVPAEHRDRNGRHLRAPTIPGCWSTTSRRMAARSRCASITRS